ncbi:hypothetical protein M426DRAFT_26680 [Hypoxylon sp. CI-4A]|nr:hypothetical protein M426DRAFT_26680 [Hypoxylon sp. CI-4A]
MTRRQPLQQPLQPQPQQLTYQQRIQFATGPLAPMPGPYNYRQVPPVQELFNTSRLPENMAPIDNIKDEVFAPDDLVSGDLNEITRKHSEEDLRAYCHELIFLRRQLEEPTAPAEECRKLQLRIIDCTHNIRRCQHQLEMLDFKERKAAAAHAASMRAASMRASSTRPLLQPTLRRSSVGPSGTATGTKRRRSDSEELSVDGKDSPLSALDGEPINSVQRLGFWKCRLCVSKKYLEAGTNRVPSAPCKWPLKDVSKVLNHYLDMHTEHTPEERCSELGFALGHNRGPFEYWLTRTRAQEIEDPEVIDDLILTLQAGSMPMPLRGLSRAARTFPNTIASLILKR